LGRKFIGQHAGVISGSALLVDYALTITVSLAACGDAVFSFLPASLHQFKLIFVIFPLLCEAPPKPKNIAARAAF
jgi:hypothetical protein